MKFAKYVFRIAGIWGILVLTPLYFIFNQIAEKDPPPVTHPLFYYGFAGVALAWQPVFLVIGSNPMRFRPLMLVSILEKLGYFLPAIVLYLQHRVHPADLFISFGDALLAVLFLTAYFKTQPSPKM
jgi:O-antigen/teichoic acid export membrane protein